MATVTRPSGRRWSLSRSTADTPTATGTATATRPAPVNGNGNGHHDEAPEPQQSLFSWAEFMAEEPVKPRGRKTQAPSLSLFEWAVEQEREEEPVGAGR